MSSATFVDDALTGVAGIADVDSYVDAWHESDTTLELHEFLGFTWDEYRLWVEKPNSLRFILSARRHGNTVTEELSKTVDGLSLAARAGSADEAESVLIWLRETGRL
ncbi:hypothetical protein ACGF3G_11555 [Streptomyces sp. NPDC048179]|uniref:hypothetical protein n=1 Tax=Streptomyces sp. NPDC048179 TaxID=3365506 RepID=UPI0037172ED9